MRFIILLIIFLLPGTLMAEVFTPPATDKSVDLLGYVFGSNIGLVNLGGSANPALLHMFEKFNSIVFTIGGIIISYVGIISTINTAQEGQVMGKKWSSVWIPMRSALGMLLIIPTPGSGYSIVQVAVMWCIMNSIGVADNIWNGILTDFGNGVSAARAIDSRDSSDLHIQKIYNSLEQTGEDMAESLLRSAVCMQTIHKINNGTAIEPPGGFRTPESPLGFALHTNNIKSLGHKIQTYEMPRKITGSSSEHVEYSGGLRIGLPDNNHEFHSICGEYHITGTANKTDWDKSEYVTNEMLEKKAIEIYHRKREALILILQSFMPLANHLVDTTASPSYEPPVEFAGHRFTSMSAYREVLKNLVKPKRIDSVQDIIRSGKLNGWIAAGSFYFTLNQTQPIDFCSDITVPPQAKLIPTCDDAKICQQSLTNDKIGFSEQLKDFMQYEPEINYLRSKLWNAKLYMDKDNEIISERLKFATASSDTSTTNADMQAKMFKIAQEMFGHAKDNPIVTDINRYFKKLQQNNKAANKGPLHIMQANMLDLLHEMMHSQHSDPLIAQGRFGASIMLLSEHSLLNIQNELEATIKRAEIEAKAAGIDSTNQDIYNSINKLNTHGNIALIVHGIVWVIGAMLAIYTPLVPYMIFTIGVVGWLLLVIEATVAAPILAISFMLPTNDELGKVVQGLLLLLNILLRPVLMLFGFILATRLYQAVVKLVNFGMLTNFETLNTTESLFAWVAILTLYATFVIGLSNKCFTLIHALPDKVLRWMGGSPEHTDTTHELKHSQDAISKSTDMSVKVSTGIHKNTFTNSLSKSTRLKPPPDAVSD